MVTVKTYHVRNGEDGKQFISLELEGEISFVQSQKTGRFYASAKRCFMYAAFDEQTAARLVGTQMQGTIERVGCDPYDYKIPETGELKTLSYTYEFRPAEVIDPSEFLPTKIKHALA